MQSWEQNQGLLDNQSGDMLLDCLEPLPFKLVMLSQFHQPEEPDVTPEKLFICPLNTLVLEVTPTHGTPRATFTGTLFRVQLHFTAVFLGTVPLVSAFS